MNLCRRAFLFVPVAAVAQSQTGPERLERRVDKVEARQEGHESLGAHGEAAKEIGGLKENQIELLKESAYIKGAVQVLAYAVPILGGAIAILEAIQAFYSKRSQATQDQLLAELLRGRNERNP